MPVSEPRAVATGSFIVSHLPFFICHFRTQARGLEKVIDSADDDKGQMKNDK